MGLWQWTVISVGSEGAGRASLEDESDLGRAELAEKVGPTVIIGMGTSPRRRQGKTGPGRGARPLQPEPVGASDTRQKRNRYGNTERLAPKAARKTHDFTSASPKHESLLGEFGQLCLGFSATPLGRGLIS